MNKIILFSALLAITACATPYQPPSGPIPAQWSGPGGIVDKPDTVAFFDGTMGKDGVLMEHEFTHRRTARVKNTVQTKTAYGGDLIVPEGAVAYAMTFAIYRSVGYSSPERVNASNDPTEWCVILEKGSTGKEDKAELYCLFWESSASARYIKSYNDFVYSPLMFGEANGMSGPVPELEEQPVDMGVTLKKQMFIEDINDKRVKVRWRETDGTGERSYGNGKHKWDAEGNATISTKYGTIVLHKNGDETVTVTHEKR